MGWAERSNPMSWRNRTPEQKKEGLRAVAVKEARKLTARESLRKLIAEHRKRRAAAQGANEARQGNKEATAG